MNFRFAALIALAGMVGCTSTPTCMQMNADNAVLDAMDTLRQAAEDRQWDVRSYAIEALSQTVGAKEGGLFLQALGDPEPRIQFAAAMAIGEIRYEPAKATLQKMAQVAGPDRRVYAAVIYALHRMGDTSHTQDIVRLLSHRETEVRAVTAMVIGRLGEPTAVELIEARLSDEHDARVELNMVEALALLGNTRGRNMLQGYARWPILENQMLAVYALAKTRADNAVVVLTELSSGRHALPVRIAAAGGLAQMGIYSDALYGLCRKAVTDPLSLAKTPFGPNEEIKPSDVAMIQRLGAISLGYMGRTAAVDSLHAMLRCQDGSIRVAAAMSILRLLAPYYTPAARTVLSVPQAPKTVAAPTPTPAPKPVPTPTTTTSPTTTAAAVSRPSSSPATVPTTVPATATAPANGFQELPSLPKLESSGPK